MSCALNLSSVVLPCYPEQPIWPESPFTSPADVERPGAFSPCKYFPPELQESALKQALATKLNPYHFICWHNPYKLDMSTLTDDDLPALVSPPGFQPLRRASTEMQSLTFLKVLHVGTNTIVSRICIGDTTFALKLFFGNDGSARFVRECTAYAHFNHFNLAEAGAVPGCSGWLELDTHVVLGAFAKLGNAPVHWRESSLKGILLEDLTGGESLSIHNATDNGVAEQVMRSLRKIHTAHVMHGSITPTNVIVFTAKPRAVWVGFSHSACNNHQDIGLAKVSRTSLLAELAAGWDLLFAKLVPDSLIGFERDEDTVDPETICGPVVHHREPPIPLRPRVPASSVEEEIACRLLAYPEANVFSWDPPLAHLTPPPKYDHQFDTPEFLRENAIAYDEYLDNSLSRWYGNCPLLIYDRDTANKAPPFKEYAAPAPVTKLSSQTAIEFLEHIAPWSNHPLMRVRIGNEERLLKIFSSGRVPGRRDSKSNKERFKLELEAYGHLIQYGACTLGPRTRGSGFEYRNSHGVREEPAWVYPIFDDGSFASALVLEYFPNTEAISWDTLTPSRADLALRALSCVHGAYVLYQDYETLSNFLIVPATLERPERVVVIDFDHALTPPNLKVARMTLLNELITVWGMFYNTMLPNRRMFCPEPVHPHKVNF
ncbi:hypothetical protein BD413DRAFT_496622 [Trametes elegans]|nr:hypothetical protein BD413DRAFT_496622 [Trametes elegans]